MPRPTPEYGSTHIEPPGQPRLFVQWLRPSGRVRGAAAFIHGFNSAGDYQLPLMGCLAEAGFACYAADCRGHGRSGGEKCQILSFDEYMEDAAALTGFVTAREERAPFLFGNSLGGLIASIYAARQPEGRLRGVLLTAPFYAPAFKLPLYASALITAVSRWMPSCRLPRRHPRQPPIVTMRWWTETRRAQALWKRESAIFRLPTLILHGAEDRVACPAASFDRFSRMQSADKEIGFLPGAGHEDLDPSWGPEWWPTARRWLLDRTAG